MLFRILYTIIALVICALIYVKIENKKNSLGYIIITTIIATIIYSFFIPSDISIFDILNNIDYESNSNENTLNEMKNIPINIENISNDIESTSKDTGDVIPRVEIGLESLELISTDEYTLKATIFPENIHINWNSDNMDVVNVGNDGKLKAINEGSATITATIVYKDVEYVDTCYVVVKSPNINFDAPNLLHIGESEVLSVTTIPEKANIIWNSNNSDIVTVNDNGEIIGVKEGTATITAIMAYNNQNYSANCKINVNSILDNNEISDKLEATVSESYENSIAGSSTSDFLYIPQYNEGLESNSYIKSDITEQNDAIEPEDSKPDPPKQENVESALAFSDDVKISIYPNSDCIFYLDGYISSNYGLTCVKFNLTTPGAQWPYGETLYNNGPKIYYLNDINSTINANTFDFGYEYNGDFVLVITATDSSGKNVSKTISWSYYE